MTKSQIRLRIILVLRTAALIGAATGGSANAAPSDQPWLNSALSADDRALALNRALTVDEQLGLVHGQMAMPIFGLKIPKGAIGSAGYVAGVERLGVPALQETDAGLGISNLLNMRPGDVATPLPSGPALAATFDPSIAKASGAMIGREAWSKGFNVLLGGGMDLIRDPRSGRNFEYLSEDPLLSGVMAGEIIRGVQSQHVITTAKHYAFNDQETGRFVLNAKIDEAAARESDLLAFEIALERGQPGSVMCAYNRFDGAYACENDFLLNKVLKRDWSYPGWVMSDWGAVHSTEAALKGLDQESGEQRDKTVYFGEPLRVAVLSGQIPRSRLADMSLRILRSMFAVGLFDHPPQITPIDYAADARIAQAAEREGIVLLSNHDRLLPLPKTVKSIAVIGGHADAGVLSGGGSSQVIPDGGAARSVPLGGDGMMGLIANMVFDPPSPMAALKSKLPGATLKFVDGRYPKAAADAARSADVAIVFATQWMGEGGDLPDLSLPSGQDDLISAVTQANPHTIVVLETGGPVTMPWLSKAGAVMEAWYPGAGGAQSIADVLVGDADAAGRLPVSFPKREDQLPHPLIPGVGVPEGRPFEVAYTEGADVGYRWYAKTRLRPLFPFGYGLSYTAFGYSALTLKGGRSLTAQFDVTNTGARSGVDTPQLYLVSAHGDARLRLLGWSKTSLRPGETKHVTVTVDPRLLADFQTASHNWRIAPGQYHVAVGASSQDLRLSGATWIDLQTIRP